ncbi:MAG: class I SAM-dependent methyltransferase [Halothiobacillaceae bacterium]
MGMSQGAQTTTLVVEDAQFLDDAEVLARQIGIKRVDVRPNSGMALSLGFNGLSLQDCDSPRDEPLRVDFTGGALGFRQRAGFRRDELLARAVGIKGHPLPRVLDATAGLGRDAFMLASLGCEVVLCERHPVVHALLADGLRRGHEDGLAALSRMRLCPEDAAVHLAAAASAGAYDVIVLDPMFPERMKSALVKKPMRMFHALVGADEDAAGLLELALSCALRRVVVKRPLHAEHLGGRVPSLDYRGKAVRFDVYMTKNIF